jgi:hypothetical protein
MVKIDFQPIKAIKLGPFTGLGERVLPTPKGFKQQQLQIQ